MLIAVIAGALLLFGLVSRRAERSPVTPPLFFVAVGFLLGPSLLGAIEPESERPWIHALAELTLVLVLFTDAARIHLDCLRREESLPARLLGIGMPLTSAAGAVGAPGWRAWPARVAARLAGARREPGACRDPRSRTASCGTATIRFRRSRA
jgi:NhaP-type Na+/H+ or K+/H+ antiporter